MSNAANSEGVREKIDQIEESDQFKKWDGTIRKWMLQNGLFALRISIGVVFFWFGILKFFPGASPAHELAVNTISTLTFGIFSNSGIIIGLAIWEVIIGIGLLTGKLMRITLFLLFLQLPGTFLPVFFYPELVFDSIPFVPTIKGQYILKNLVLISAAILLGGFLKKQPTGGLKKPKKVVDEER